MDGEDPLFGGETGRPMHSNRRVEGDRLEARTWSGPLPLPLLTPPNCPLYQTPRLVTRFLPTPRLVTEHCARVQRRRGPLPPSAGALQGELGTCAARAAQPSACTAAICCVCCPRNPCRKTTSTGHLGEHSPEILFNAQRLVATACAWEISPNRQNTLCTAITVGSSTIAAGWERDEPSSPFQTPSEASDQTLSEADSIVSD